MHSIAIIGTNKILQMPETPLEFTKAQFLAFAENLALLNTKQINLEQFQVRLVYSFLNLKRTIDVSKPQNLPAIENVAALAKLTNAYFDEKNQNGKTVKVLKMDFYRQLLPSFTCGGVRFYGPNDAFFNTVYGEFLQALNHFNDYSVSGEEHYLNMLIATLYRPKRSLHAIKNRFGTYRTDCRVAFHPEKTQKYANKIAKLPMFIKQAVYLYAGSCIHFLKTANGLDIGGGTVIDLAALFVPSSGNNAKSLGMIGTLYSIAETKVFGPTDAVAKQNTIDVLAFMVDQKNKIDNQKTQKNANDK